MADICREAGVSPGALYTYFVSKEDLIAGLCGREMERFTHELSRIAGQLELLPALQSLAEQYCCHEPISKVRLHVEIGTEAGRNPAIRRTILETEQIIGRAIVALIEKEAAAGRFVPALPAATIVQAMFALGDGLFLKRALDPDFDPKPIIPAMMMMISALLQPVPRDE